MSKNVSKRFFFKKKKQKTFAPLVRDVGQRWWLASALKEVKFFCFFLFTKRSSSLLNFLAATVPVSKEHV